MDKDIRMQIVEIGRLMYDRHLTDSAGGNISVRDGERVYITPRYAGSKQRWQLAPEDIMVVDLEGKLLEENPHQLSRESRMHLAIYRTFPLAGAVIHGHPQNIMVFAAAEKSIPPVIDVARKFGVVRPIPWTPAHSEELALKVVETLKPEREALEKHALAVILPRHGIIVAGRDLSDAYDSLERIENNARCVLLSALLNQIHLEEV